MRWLLLVSCLGETESTTTFARHRLRETWLNWNRANQLMIVLSDRIIEMSNEGRKKFFLDKQEEQRHLLNKSVKEMTEGDLAEAIRVATVLRTLIHETG